MEATPEHLLCDTSFVGHNNRRATRPADYQHWPAATVDRLNRAIKAISVITLAEERYGYRKGKWAAAKIASAEQRLAGYLQIPLDMAVVDEWARLRELSVASGWTVGDNDLWIAATATARGLPLVTCDRNQARIGDTGLEVIFLEPQPRTEDAAG